MKKMILWLCVLLLVPSLANKPAKANYPAIHLSFRWIMKNTVWRERLEHIQKRHTKIFFCQTVKFISIRFLPPISPPQWIGSSGRAP